MLDHYGKIYLSILLNWRWSLKGFVVFFYCFLTIIISKFIFRFINGKMNTCYEMIDRHVDEGHGDQVGLIYDSPVTDSKQKFTYKQLQEEVCI